MLKIIKHPREWSLASVFILVSGLVLLGVCGVIIVTPPHNVARPNAIRSGQVVRNETIATNTIDVDYPVLNLEKVDAALKNYAHKATSTYMAKVKHKKANPRDKLTFTYKILHYGQRLVTVAFHSKEEIVGRKPVKSQTIVTFDLKTQTKLNFADLFKTKAKARSALTNLLYDHCKQFDAGLSSLEEMKLLNLKLANIRDFTVGKDIITLHLNLHDLPSKRGVHSVAIKKSLLASVLKAEYVAPDNERQPDKFEATTLVIEKKPKRAKRINPNSKLIALTFDDGPGAHTPRLLDELKRYDAHATFFVLGSLVQQHANIMKRTVAEGNEIGNHSWNHPDLTVLSPAELQFQIHQTQTVVRDTTNGYTPVLVRPPYGMINEVVSAYLQSQKLTETLWNVDPNDWLERDAGVVFDKIMASASDGSTVVLHDIYPSSVDGVARAIPELIAQGYKLVTVSEMRTLRP